MVISVGSRELKNRLGKYLRLVREGATVLVTDRGRPVAELRALPAARTDLDSQLDALAARGLITRARQPFVASPSKLQIQIRGKSLSETVLEERADRF